MEKRSLISIAGGSGAGKSTIAPLLVAQGLNNAFVSEDCFRNANHSLTIEQKRAVNHDHPDAIDRELLVHLINELKCGRLVQLPQYSFEISERLPETTLVQPKRNTVLEGLFLYHFGETNRLTDARIFIDVPEEIRLQRRVLRDITERGRTEQSVRHQFKRDVAPMHEKFIQPLCDRADLKIDGTMPPTECVAEITDYLYKKGIDMTN